MDFSTSVFWFLLIPPLLLLLLGNRLLSNRSAALQLFHKTLMLLTSLALLGTASGRTLVIFLTVMSVAWVGGKVGLRLGTRGRKIMLWVLIPLLLSPLFFYKYSYFVGSSIFQQEWDTLRDLIIPIGLSFYTFQIIGFCVDTLLRHEPMPKFIDYVNFCSFFPQIVAGPIERRSDLLPQVENMDLRLRKTNLEQGIPYVILGLFFKLVMADNLSGCFYAGHTAAPYLMWQHSINFTFRIYFDFAGYGLTAYGLARCMGILLQLNFMSPYTATNITDFWRRWHISLTGWFRDYIYFPLGGSRTNCWALNIIFVFFVSGIWHGAGWNFMIWGALAGVAMVIHRIFRKSGWKLPPFIGWLLTFAFMVFTWTFFYTNDMEVLGKKLSILFSAEGYNKYDINWYFNVISSGHRGSYLFAPMLLLSSAVIFLEYLSWKKKGDPYKLFLSPVACGTMIALMFILVPHTHNPFIYFAF